MQPIAVKLNAHGQVISPDVHDLELISLKMNLDRIEIVAADFCRRSAIEIHCINPDYIQFKSDHLQNVIAAIFLLRDVSEPSLSLLPMGIRQKLLNPVVGRPLSVMIITPITGIDLLLAAEKIDIFEAAVT